MSTTATALGPNTALQRARRELMAASPATLGPSQVGAAGSLERKRHLMSARAEEARAQQLRGIFAAFDEDRDGLLKDEELPSALLALGLDPTPDALARFASASPGGSQAIDFTSVRFAPHPHPPPPFKGNSVA
jgi:hypothetical protein